MGHYRSEMGFEEQDRKEAEWRKKRHDELVVRVSRALEKEGLAEVLAKIIEGSKKFGHHSPPEFWEYRDDT